MQVHHLGYRIKEFYRVAQSRAMAVNLRCNFFFNTNPSTKACPRRF